MKVAIIGGGIIGVTCAYYLQKKGYSITLIDKGDLTAGCSFGNAGYVSPSHFTPLASPGIIAQGLRWMLSSSSPFYIKPRLSPDLLKWGYHFWKSANSKTVEKHAPPMNALLQFSRQLTSEIKNSLGNHFRMQEKGCFMLYKHAETEKHEIELAQKAAEFGIETRILTTDEIQRMEPQVTIDVRGGVLYPIDAHLHPGEFMQTLLKHLLEGGIELVKNAAIKGFEKKAGKIKGVITNDRRIDADEVVIAAGSWLPLLARQLGIRILLQPGKGYSLTFQQLERNLQYPAILVDDRVAMTPLGNDLRMGGTMEISGINDRILTKRVQAIFNAARKYYTDLPVAFPETTKVWSGLRPLSPDGLPYIGRSRQYDNVIIAGGHAMLGLSLAAGTGKIVEELVSRQPTSVSIEAFRIERFN